MKKLPVNEYRERPDRVQTRTRLLRIFDDDPRDLEPRMTMEAASKLMGMPESSCLVLEREALRKLYEGVVGLVMGERALASLVRDMGYDPESRVDGEAFVRAARPVMPASSRRARSIRMMRERMERVDVTEEMDRGEGAGVVAARGGQSARRLARDAAADHDGGGRPHDGREPQDSLEAGSCGPGEAGSGDPGNT